MDVGEYDYHRAKRPDKTYASKRFNENMRIASKVMDTDAERHFASVREEVVLRELPGIRHEIKATFTEDDRRISVLTFQKWRIRTASPMEKVSFSFRDDEITRLIEFLGHIRTLYFPDAKAVNVLDADLKVVTLSDTQTRQLLTEKPDLVAQIARHAVTEEDIVALGYRRKQLQRFERLLHEDGFFKRESERLGMTPEDLWQHFFEANQWIFGYGLSYVFTSGLDSRKLEQTVRGHSLASSGKRADGLLKTQALINALCFVEIKRHDTQLLNTDTYRSDVWAPSRHLAGGVAQLQETVRGALETLTERFRPEGEDGIPTGEELFNVHPRSFLVIGSLGQFQHDGALNMKRYRCFESFRRNLHRPEVVTFDELHHRARFIVEHHGGTTADST